MIQNNNTDIIKAAYGNLYSTFMRRNRKAIAYYCYFDADEDAETRRAELLAIKEEFGVEFELFLLPNDKDAGAL